MANGFANFPEGVTSFGAPMLGGMYIPVPQSKEAGGQVWVVANDSRGTTTTIGNAIKNAKNGDTILILGTNTDYDEQIVAPLGLSNITVIGAGSTPRAVRWKNGSNNANDLIKVQGSGWVFRNIYFTGGTAAFCIRLFNDGSHNAFHTHIYDCEFNGGCGHILSDGGASNILLMRNRFIEAIGGTVAHPGSVVEVSTAQQIPTNWEIAYNTFYNSTNFLYLSLSRSMVHDNIFQVTGEDTTATNIVNLAGFLGNVPLANVVTRNTYAGYAAASITIANGFNYGTTGNHNFGTYNIADDAIVYGNPT